MVCQTKHTFRAAISPFMVWLRSPTIGLPSLSWCGKMAEQRRRVKKDSNVLLTTKSSYYRFCRRFLSHQMSTQILYPSVSSARRLDISHCNLLQESLRLSVCVNYSETVKTIHSMVCLAGVPLWMTLRNVCQRL